MPEGKKSVLNRVWQSPRRSSTVPQRKPMDHIYYPDERHGLVSRPGLGLIHICYGQGVGKSTRSVGLAVRAAASGMRVFFVQFMKSGD